ncbi:hypothetical protein Q604_UNBC03288G0001, partial [human gut metagenome]
LHQPIPSSAAPARSPPSEKERTETDTAAPCELTVAITVAIQTPTNLHPPVPAALPTRSQTRKSPEISTISGLAG